MKTSPACKANKVPAERSASLAIVMPDQKSLQVRTTCGNYVAVLLMCENMTRLIQRLRARIASVVTPEFLV